MKKVIVAIDSFKGSASSVGASVAACRGILEIFPGAKVIGVPIADGGEGTVDAFFTATSYIEGEKEYGKRQGEYILREVTGPDFQTVSAKYCILPDGKTAVVEMAQASGLTLTTVKKAGQATTYGTGELICDAVKRGCKKIIIGIGGSATNDCGIGALSAMGVKFIDKDGNTVKPCGDELPKVDKIETSEMTERIRECEIILACDVTNTLCGHNGASRVYGPQKGATEEDVERLDRNLYSFAKKMAEFTGKNVIDEPSSGAAGGLAGGLMAFFNVRVCSGITLLLETIKFDKIIDGADFIITGEGRIDSQSVYGKAVSGISEFARRANIPIIALAGELTDDYDYVADEIALDAAFSISHAARPLEEVIEKTEYNIYDTVKNICRIWKIAGRKR
ncbi:MAG: glycerate kinase [Ruminococcaceae bacterium]|nr:glycerate kinase [Oscillospiraceae bacterium]